MSGIMWACRSTLQCIMKSQAVASPACGTTVFIGDHIRHTVSCKT